MCTSMKDANPLRVLMIDDSSDDVDLFQMAVARRDPPCLQLRVSLNGEEAVQYLKAPERRSPEFPQFVLLDLNMPGRNGLEVLHDLKQDRALKRIPVFIFSTSNAPSEITRAYDLGASAYFVKPDTFEELVEFIDTCCEFWMKAEFPPISTPPLD